jgi:hypothetical protein
MSRIRQQIVENVETLPDDMQKETLDIVQFLQSKLNKNVTYPPKTETNGAALATLMA